MTSNLKFLEDRANIIADLAQRTDYTGNMNELRSALIAQAALNTTASYSLSQIDHINVDDDIDQIIAILDGIIGTVCEGKESLRNIVELVMVLTMACNHFQVVQIHTQEIKRFHSECVKKIGEISESELRDLDPKDLNIVRAVLNRSSLEPFFELDHLIDDVESYKLFMVLSKRHLLERKFLEIKVGLKDMYDDLCFSVWGEKTASRPNNSVWCDLDLCLLLPHLRFVDLENFVLNWHTTMTSYKRLTPKRVDPRSNLQMAETIHSLFAEICEFPISDQNVMNDQMRMIDKFCSIIHSDMKVIETETLYNQIRNAMHHLGVKQMVMEDGSKWDWRSVKIWIGKNKFYLLAVLRVDVMENDKSTLNKLMETVYTFSQNGPTPDPLLHAFALNFTKVRADSSITQSVWDGWADVKRNDEDQSDEEDVISLSTPSTGSISPVEYDYSGRVRLFRSSTTIPFLKLRF